MDSFWLFFKMGTEHILDLKGYDHILFVMALCTLYTFKDWRSVLVLVTAFTVGHSITLALATLRVVTVNSELVEFLIPLTILVTAITNLFRQEKKVTSGLNIGYLFAAGFGLIHGLGFSNYLRTILGSQQEIVSPLLAFNLGLEAGQLVIVLIFLTVTYVATSWFPVSRRDWKMVISSAIGGIAFTLMLPYLIEKF